MSLRSEWDQDTLWKLQSLDQFKSARLRIPHESHAATYSNGEKEYYRCSTWLDLYHEWDNFGSSLYFGKVLKKAGNNATSFRIWVTAAGAGFGLYSSYAKAELTHEACLSYERDIPPAYKYLEEPKTSSHKQFTDHDQFLYGRRGNINKYFAKWYSTGFVSNEHDYHIRIRVLTCAPRKASSKKGKSKYEQHANRQCNTNIERAPPSLVCI